MAARERKSGKAQAEKQNAVAAFSGWPFQLKKPLNLYSNWCNPLTHLFGGARRWHSPKLLTK
jgi:hypothetical protein